MTAPEGPRLESPQGEPPPAHEPPAPTKKPLSPEAKELLVVLAFAYMPSLFTSLLSLVQPVNAQTSTVVFLEYVLQVAQTCIPLLYIVYRSNRPWKEIGLSRPQWRDLLWAFAIFLAGIIASYVAMFCIAAFHPSYADRTRVEEMFPRVELLSDYFAVLLASLAVGFGEELLFRGYLITRWRQLSGSTGQAVAASTVLFGIAHAYQGLAGVLSAAAIGLVYAGFFIKLRRLWPLALAHALTDFISLSRV